jgi:hypothetical protein
MEEKMDYLSSLKTKAALHEAAKKLGLDLKQAPAIANDADQTGKRRFRTWVRNLRTREEIEALDPTHKSQSSQNVNFWQWVAIAALALLFVAVVFGGSWYVRSIIVTTAPQIEAGMRQEIDGLKAAMSATPTSTQAPTSTPKPTDTPVPANTATPLPTAIMPSTVTPTATPLPTATMLPTTVPPTTAPTVLATTGNPPAAPATYAFATPSGDPNGWPKTTINEAPLNTWFHRVFNKSLFVAPNWNGADSWFVSLNLGSSSGGNWTSHGNPGQVVFRGTSNQINWSLGILTTSQWKSQFMENATTMPAAINVRIAPESVVTVTTASGKVIQQATSDMGDITIILPDNGIVTISVSYTTAAPTHESLVWWGPYDRSVSINTVDAR